VRTKCQGEYLDGKEKKEQQDGGKRHNETNIVSAIHLILITVNNL
jgi:hypothetical protein